MNLQNSNETQLRLEHVKLPDGNSYALGCTFAEASTIYTELENSKQDLIDSTHKLSADLVDDTNTTNKFVTANEKQTWNGKQDKLTISSGAHSGEWMSNTGYYYIITNEVNTLVVVLYQNGQANGLQEIVWNFTTGNTPNVTFNAGSGGNIYVADGFEIEASSTYEVNALWNGTNWYIAGIKLINTASV